MDAQITLLIDVFRRPLNALLRRSFPTIFASPLLNHAYCALLLDNLKTFLTPGQALRSFKSALKEAEQAYHTIEAGGRRTHPSIERASDPIPMAIDSSANDAADASMLSLNLLLHLLRVCIQSLPPFLTKFSPEEVDDLRNHIHALESLIKTGIIAGIGSIQLQESAMLVASLLSTCYMLGETNLGGVSDCSCESALDDGEKEGIVKSIGEPDYPILKGCEGHLVDILIPDQENRLPCLTIETVGLLAPC